MDKKPPRPSRRQHARYPCRLGARIWEHGYPRKLEAVILDIGMGGALVRVKGTLPVPGEARLEVPVGEDPLLLKARVVRAAGKDPKDRAFEGYGLAFLLEGRSHLRLKRLVDQVRKDIEFKPDLTRDYWNL